LKTGNGPRLRGGHVFQEQTRDLVPSSAQRIGGVVNDVGDAPSGRFVTGAAMTIRMA
jgi:hypothetical protein